MGVYKKTSSRIIKQETRFIRKNTALPLHYDLLLVYIANSINHKHKTHTFASFHFLMSIQRVNRV